jgi:hypothetical protein
VSEPTEVDLLLLDMVRQHIEPDKDGHRFSGFIGINAEALRYLVKIGLMQAAPGEKDYLDGSDRNFTAIDNPDDPANEPPTPEPETRRRRKQ